MWRRKGKLDSAVDGLQYSTKCAYTDSIYVITEREVKKANRELHSHTSKMSEIQKIEYLTKRCSDLFADMKRHERENIKNKKRADQLQKEKDSARSELTKQNGLKEKLEKLCRELQKENNKLKVSTHHIRHWSVLPPLSLG